MEGAEEEVPQQPEEPESPTPEEIALEPLLSPVSSRSQLEVISTDINMKDPLFPYSPSFATKTRKEKEILFMRAFDAQKEFIRNKELKCVNTPVESLLDETQVAKYTDGRQSSYESSKSTESRKAITRKETEASNSPPNRVDVDLIPTFNPLLNVHFESQFSLLDKFKGIISNVLLRNRASQRAQKLSQYLVNETNNAVKSLQDKIDEQTQITAASLLSLKISCFTPMPKFAKPTELTLPEPPELNIEPHRVEKPFSLYEPNLIEKFQLNPFVRTDISTFVAVPVPPPEHYPTVKEEQPIRERTIPSLDIEEAIKETVNAPEIPSTTIALPKIVHHPREIKYFEFDPAYCLRPQPISLPDLPDEIGRASILALPLSDYEKMTMSGKSKAPFAPFDFAGVPKFNSNEFQQMTQADPLDLKELEADDDIDNIDIQPKVKPITDFITKPLNTKNKSHVLAEAMTEGQSQWRERQRKGVNELIEKMSNLNNLMKDKSLFLPIGDLEEYMKQ